MTRYLLILFLLIFLAPLTVPAQLPEPIPVAEIEVREGSIKMRSLELERIKREANKVHSTESSASLEKRFSIVRKDFERIQKLEDLIIAGYTRSEKIDYEKIAVSAGEISKSGTRLVENLFGEKRSTGNDDPRTPENGDLSVRELIIELDGAIGDFVQSSMFKDNKIVESDVSEKALADLKEVIALSLRLAKAAGVRR